MSGDDTGRLQWQCRRGIKEVEVLLVPFFQQRYADLSAEGKQVFERLLACHDVDLFEWFTERSKSEDSDIQEMVDEILRTVGG